MASSSARNVYAAIIKQWPVDPLRPNLPFQRTLALRLDRDFPAEGAKDQKDTIAASDAAEAEEATSTWFNSSPKRKSEEEGVPQVKKSTTPQEAQWAALKPLLDNTFMKAYPVTEKITSPLSNPDYYRNLLHELDEAPKRSFLNSYLNSWKGFIRWQ